VGSKKDLLPTVVGDKLSRQNQMPVQKVLDVVVAEDSCSVSPERTACMALLDLQTADASFTITAVEDAALHTMVLEMTRLAGAEMDLAEKTEGAVLISNLLLASYGVGKGAQNIRYQPLVLDIGHGYKRILSGSVERFCVGSDPRCHWVNSLFDPLHCTLQLDDGFLFVTCCVTNHPPIVIQRADPAIPEFSLPSGMQARMYVGDTLHINTEVRDEYGELVAISVTIDAYMTSLHSGGDDFDPSVKVWRTGARLDRRGKICGAPRRSSPLAICCDPVLQLPPRRCKRKAASELQCGEHKQ
jgi:hypothetical protein